MCVIFEIRCVGYTDRRSVEPVTPGNVVTIFNPAYAWIIPIDKISNFGDITGKYFWSDGYAYGTVEISDSGKERSLTLNVLNGQIDISKITITGFGSFSLKKITSIETGAKQSFIIKAA